MTRKWAFGQLGYQVSPYEGPGRGPEGGKKGMATTLVKNQSEARILQAILGLCDTQTALSLRLDPLDPECSMGALILSPHHSSSHPLFRPQMNGILTCSMCIVYAFRSEAQDRVRMAMTCIVSLVPLLSTSFSYKKNRVNLGAPLQYGRLGHGLNC